MSIQAHIAKHFREINFGEGGFAPNLKDVLEGVTWETATEQVLSFNTITSLVFHIDYYVRAVLQVLDEGILDAHDKYSYDMEPITSKADWERLKAETAENAERLARMVESFPEDRLWDTFVKEKYGDFYTNFHHVIEHSHYHLGQIVLIKKVLVSSDEAP